MKEAASVAERASVLMLKIYRGDDTGGTLGKHISVKVDSDFPLTGCTVNFDFQGVRKSFTGVTSGQVVEIIYSHNETMCMREGVSNARLSIVDSSGKVRTVSNTLAIKVTSDVEECYGTENQKITCKLSLLVSWDYVEDKPKIDGHELQKENDAHDLGLARTEDVPTLDGEVLPLVTDDEVREALKRVIVILGGNTNV